MPRRPAPSGFFRAGAEKERARAAIAAIHARLGSHLRGGVALADSDTRGGLSSVDD